LEKGEKLSVSLSVGVASFPEDADTDMQLVAVSDRALYKAKQSRSKKVCCGRDASD
jgi:predicted signal transduction protein with EAL and GGDEF domain